MFKSSLSPAGTLPSLSIMECRIAATVGFIGALIGSVWLVAHLSDASVTVAHGLTYGCLLATVIAFALHCTRLNTRIEESEGLFCQAIESVDGCAIFTLDEKGSVSSWNHPAGELVGRDAHEAVGRGLNELFDRPSRPEELTHTIHEARAKGWSTADIKLDADAGESVALRLTVTALQGHGANGGFLVTVREAPIAPTASFDPRMSTDPVATASATASTTPKKYSDSAFAADSMSQWSTPVRAAIWCSDPDARDLPLAGRHNAVTVLRAGDATFPLRKSFPGADAPEPTRGPFDFKHSQARALFMEMAAERTTR